ncbi:MAG: hypothetical protein F4X95_04245 [Oligoflexia bacterium]|nr:hypothetical protein [Bdellovibrionales bacterium]MYE07943.1 hypothetical protein [Oligoflexia bacterium]
MKKKAFLLIGMGFEAAVLLWFFIYIGQKGDHYFDMKGSITSVLVILVMIVWFYQFIRLFR